MQHAAQRAHGLQREGIATILVFRALQVGDMLCAVPALRALRATFPRARVILAGLPWAAQFARRHARLIDDFIAFPGHPSLPEQACDGDATDAFFHRVRALHADLAVQLHGSGEVSNAIVRQFGARISIGHTRRPELDPGFVRYPEQGHEIERLCGLIASLGATDIDLSLDFPLTADDERELQSAGLAGLEERQVVCLHPGARDPGRCWPVACFAAVGDHLARNFGASIVLTGSGSEHGLAAEVAAQMKAPAINAALPISLGAMAALMRRSRLLVCNDTGASHIAAALRVRSVVVFNRSDPARWAPLDRQRHRCVQDPDGTRAAEVIEAAAGLMQASCR